MERIVCLLWLALASSLGAVDPPGLPPEVKGQPGAFIQVPAMTDCPHVMWYSPDVGLNVFPVQLLKDSKTAVVTATSPGRYRLVAWVAKDSEPSSPAVCVVVVGDAPEPQPPGPGPKPPEPGPSDPLLAKLQDAYDASTDAKKAEHAATLAELYRQAATLARDEKIKTAGDLYAKIAAASGMLLPRDALRKLRGVVQVELDSSLPTDTETVLTERHRQEIQGTLTHLAELMGRLSK